MTVGLGHILIAMALFPYVIGRLEAEIRYLGEDDGSNLGCPLSPGVTLMGEEAVPQTRSRDVSKSYDTLHFRHRCLCYEGQLALILFSGQGEPPCWNIFRQ